MKQIVSNVAFTLAHVFAGLSMATGTFAMLHPFVMAHQFGIPIPDTSIVSTRYVQAYGSRNFVNGLALMIICLMNQRKAAGALVLTGVVAASADGYFTQRCRGEGWTDYNVLSHLGFVPGVIAVGLILLRG